MMYEKGFMEVVTNDGLSISWFPLLQARCGFVHSGVNFSIASLNSAWYLVSINDNDENAIVITSNIFSATIDSTRSILNAL
mmetsp:Transcript_10140/g.17290  ORF Transcript_10140/g.17290 Transcript_10140/m.17290 type:complete len:81 (+) Transcript_10140:1246-1488(+)